LHVTDGRVDVLKLWLQYYPGDMHADLQKLNDTRLSKNENFREVINPQEYVMLRGLVVA
jgi:hypothetical protein